MAPGDFSGYNISSNAIRNLPWNWIKYYIRKVPSGTCNYTIKFPTEEKRNKHGGTYIPLQLHYN
jgi:hypothetical protein